MTCDMQIPNVHITFVHLLSKGNWIKGDKVFLGNRRSALVRELYINLVENIFQ